MRKILYVTTIDKTVYRFLIPHINILIENGDEVHVACNILEKEESEKLEETIKFHNISFSRNPLSLKNKKAIKEIKELQRKNKYDIVHVHTPVGAFITRYALRKEKDIKIIYTCHGFHFYDGAPLLNWIIYYPLERIGARWTDRIITINNEDFERAKNLKLRKENEVYLMNGTGVKKEDYRLENFDREKYRRSLGVLNNDFMVLVLSELNKNKNHIQIIKAVNSIQDNKNIKVICAGEGPELERLKDIVKNLKLEENIKFLGFRYDVKELIESSDCVGLFSKREGLGKCLLEGALMKKPLIGTKTRGAKTIIKNNVNGFLVDVSDFKETGRIIEKLRKKEIKVEFKDEDLSKYYLDRVLKEILIYHKFFDKKRVIEVTMSGSYGGAENVIFSIIDELRDKYEFIYISPKGKIEKFLEKRNIEYIPLSIKEIRTIKGEIIHGHDFMASFLVALFKGKKKVISHLHTSHRWLKKISLKSIIYLLVSFRFKEIILVSEGMKEEIWFYNFIKNKVRILINPVKVDEVIKKAYEFEWDKEYDIAFVGRLSEYKNPIGFIKIISKIRKEKNDIKSVIIGEGELLEKCNEEIIKEKLSKNIELLGFKENPFPIMRSSKIIIAPSKVEALGLAIAEGMILGIPAICSNACGFKDFVSEDNGSLCIEVDEFKNKALELLEDEEEYKRKSLNAMKVKEYFSIEKYIEEIKKLYE